MEKIHAFRFYLQNNLLFAFGLFLCVYFTYHTLNGQRSLQTLWRLEGEIDAKGEALHHVRADRLALEERVKRLRPESLHKDYLEERVRLVLGYTKPGEKIYIQAGNNK